MVILIRQLEENYWENMELLRDYLSSFDQNASKNMYSKSYKISNGNEKQDIETKGYSCYLVAQALVELCPRHFWKAQFKSSELGFSQNF